MAVILENQKNFDIAQIARSGQCFRLKEHPQKEHTWQLVAYKHYLEVKQLPGSSTISASARARFRENRYTTPAGSL